MGWKDGSTIKCLLHRHMGLSLHPLKCTFVSPVLWAGGRWEKVDLGLELTGQPVYPNQKASGSVRDRDISPRPTIFTNVLKHIHT